MISNNITIIIYYHIFFYNIFKPIHFIIWAYLINGCHLKIGTWLHPISYLELYFNIQNIIIINIYSNINLYTFIYNVKNSIFIFLELDDYLSTITATAYI